MRKRVVAFASAAECGDDDDLLGNPRLTGLDAALRASLAIQDDDDGADDDGEGLAPPSASATPTSNTVD